MKPVIGLVPLVDDEKESLWMLPGYMEGIWQAGGLSLMLPLVTGEADLSRLFDRVDGLLLTGGHDVSPALYGETAQPACGAVSPERDAMESVLLRLAIERDRPVLGICRGLQFLNAALGGTLWQDLPTLRPSPVNHHQAPPYDRPAHGVRVMEGTPLSLAVGAGDLAVNSYHHQGVRDLSPRLSPMAVSEDGLIEALFLPERRFVWGVQWHPEFSFRADPASRAIFRAFVSACGPSSPTVHPFGKG